MKRVLKTIVAFEALRFLAWKSGLCDVLQAGITDVAERLEEWGWIS